MAYLKRTSNFSEPTRACFSSSEKNCVRICGGVSTPCNSREGRLRVPPLTFPPPTLPSPVLAFPMCNRQDHIVLLFYFPQLSSLNLVCRFSILYLYFWFNPLVHAATDTVNITGCCMHKGLIFCCIHIIMTLAVA